MNATETDEEIRLALEVWDEMIDHMRDANTASFLGWAERKKLEALRERSAPESVLREAQAEQDLKLVEMSEALDRAFACHHEFADRRDSLLKSRHLSRAMRHWLRTEDFNMHVQEIPRNLVFLGTSS